MKSVLVTFVYLESIKEQMPCGTQHSEYENQSVFISLYNSFFQKRTKRSCMVDLRLIVLIRLHEVFCFEFSLFSGKS